MKTTLTLLTFIYSLSSFAAELPMQLACSGAGVDRISKYDLTFKENSKGEGILNVADKTMPCRRGEPAG
jgi:hypothetical protein